MRPRLPSSPAPVEVDSILAEKMAGIVEQIENGEAVDIEELIRQHPDHAEDVHRLFRTVAMLADLETSSCTSTEAEAETEGKATPGGPSPGGSRPDFEDFRIICEVGRGGMGVVYEAEEVSVRRRVALKVLHDGAALDPQQLLRFKLEAHVAGGLNHPNIIPLFAIEVEHNHPYYTMQLIDGSSLARVVRELRRLEEPGSGAGRKPSCDGGRSLPEAFFGKGPLAASGSSGARPGARGLAYFREAARLGIQAAEAMEHAHRNGVIHRDIKPSNLIVDRRGHLWVADFGLARVQGNPTLTATGDLIGTLRYMSPEQISAGRCVIDHRTDIYSLGATLYELFSLVPAFPETSHTALLLRITREDPRPLRKLTPTIPVDLETIVQKAMAKNPAGRYASAQDLADDLKRFCDGEPVLARPITPFGRIARWSRRRPAEAAFALTSLLVTLCLVAGGIWHDLMLQRANRALLKALEANRKYAKQIDDERARVARESWVVRRHLYDQTMVEAQRLERAGQPERAIQILEDQIPHPGERDLRGFAWHYLWRRANREISLVHGQRAWNVRTFPTSSGGGWGAVSTDDERNLWAWDVGTGRIESRLVARPATLVATSADGKRLAWATDRPGEVWLDRDATLPGPPELLPLGGDPVSQLAFLADGRLAVGTSGKAPMLRVIGTEKDQHHWQTDTLPGELRPIASAANVNRLAWTLQSDEASITLADFSSGGVAPRITHLRAEGHRPVMPALSADGRTLASSGKEGTIRIWDLPTETSKVLAQGLNSHVDYGMTLSRDGRHVAGVGKEHNEIYVWDVATGRVEGVRRLPAYSVGELMFSPDGRDVVLGRHNIRAWIWHLEPPAEREEIAGHSDEVWATAFSPGGRILATGSNDHTARLWEAATGKAIGVLQEHVATVVSVDFTPDGRTLATGSLDGTVKLWDVASRKAIATLSGGAAEVRDVAISQDGRWLASAESDHVVRVWDLASRTLVRTLPGHTAKVRCVAFSLDGRWIASGGNDSKTFIWEMKTGRAASSFRDGQAVQAIAFSPDGETLAIGDEQGSIFLRHLASGRVTPIRAHPAVGVFSLAFDASGLSLASGGSDGAVVLWDPVTAREVLRLDGHKDRVNAVTFSDDGKTLASASHEGAVRLWRSED